MPAIPPCSVRLPQTLKVEMGFPAKGGIECDDEFVRLSRTVNLHRIGRTCLLGLVAGNGQGTDGVSRGNGAAIGHIAGDRPSCLINKCYRRKSGSR